MCVCAKTASGPNSLSEHWTQKSNFFGFLLFCSFIEHILFDLILKWWFVKICLYRSSVHEFGGQWSSTASKRSWILSDLDLSTTCDLQPQEQPFDWKKDCRSGCFVTHESSQTFSCSKRKLDVTMFYIMAYVKLFFYPFRCFWVWQILMLML